MTIDEVRSWLAWNSEFNRIQASTSWQKAQRPTSHEEVQRAAKFRIRIMRQLGILHIWVNAIGNPDYNIEDPIERLMVHNLLKEQSNENI